VITQWGCNLNEGKRGTNNLNYFKNTVILSNHNKGEKDGRISTGDKQANIITRSLSFLNPSLT